MRRLQIIRYSTSFSTRIIQNRPHFNIFCTKRVGISTFFTTFAFAFNKECKDILLNSLTITTTRKGKLLLLGLFPYRAQLSHIKEWLVVSRETYGESLRLLFAFMMSDTFNV